MSEPLKYRRILSYAGQTVWAIRLETLAVIRDLLAFRAQGGKLEQAEIEQRIAGGSRPAAQNGGSVAVIPLWGVLVPHAGMMVDVSTPGTGLDAWLNEFRAAMADPNVETILLDVNSPGGDASLVSETAAEVRAARGKKQIVAVANPMVASAAYAIACQASTFLATPSGFVGSIGCYLIHEDNSAQLAAEGIEVNVISAPEDGFKAEMFGPLSEGARAHLQDTANQFYAQFVSDVAKGRGVDAGLVEASFGRGRALTASDALKAGMVDGIQSLDQTLARLSAGQPAVGQRTRTRAEGDATATVTAAEIVADGERYAAELGLPGPALGEVLERLDAALDKDAALALVSASAAAQPGYGAKHQQSRAYAVERLGVGEFPGFTNLPLTSDHTHAVPAAPVAPSTQAAVGGTTQGGTTMETVADGRPPTLEELAAQQDTIRARIAELDEQAAGRIFNADEQTEADSLETLFDEIDATKANLNQRAATRARLAADPDRHVAGVGVGNGRTLTPASGPGRSLPENIYDLGAYRGYAGSLDELGGLLRDGAKRANERLPYEAGETDKVRAFVERLISKDVAVDTRESFAQRLLATGNPDYDAAFGKWVLRKPLSTNEERLMSSVRSQVSNAGLGGDTPVPVTIDGTVLLTSDGSVNPLRQLARVVSITGSEWRGITSDGVTVSYDSELADVDPQTPTFDGPTATPAKAHAEVQFSIEVDQDWGSFRGELTRMFQDAKDNAEADKFLNGSGTDEPEGLVFALDAAGAPYVVQTAGSNTLALTDVEGIPDVLPSRFDTRAKWLAHKKFYSAIRGLAGDEGRIDVWVPLAQGFATDSGMLPYTLLGYGVATASEMTSDLSSDSEEIAILGDYTRGFIIVDRIGMNVELDPLVRGSNGKLSGRRALYVYYRNTSKLLAANAFRMLQIKP